MDYMYTKIIYRYEIGYLDTFPRVNQSTIPFKFHPIFWSPAPRFDVIGFKLQQKLMQEM